MLFVTQLINGLQLGSIYALVALGYSMVYGIIKLLNFAHGDIIMVGGYIAIFSITHGNFPPIVAALLTVAGCTLLAVIIEKLAYTPLRGTPRLFALLSDALERLANKMHGASLRPTLPVIILRKLAQSLIRGAAPRLSLLITAIGISILLQNLAQLFFGAGGVPFPGHILLPVGNIVVGGAQIAGTSLITIAVSVASMIALALLVQKTKLGKAMRAVSEDMDASQLMGINVNRIITFTFAVGAALAGVGALLYGVRFPLIGPTIGMTLGLYAFVAAVFGGIGSIPGSMLGGYAIGLLQVFVTAVGLSGWVDGVVFLVLILILMVRPTGLMGRPMMEKV